MVGKKDLNSFGIAIMGSNPIYEISKSPVGVMDSIKDF